MDNIKREEKVCTENECFKLNCIGRGGGASYIQRTTFMWLLSKVFVFINCLTLCFFFLYIIFRLVHANCI